MNLLLPSTKCHFRLLARPLDSFLGAGLDAVARTSPSDKNSHGGMVFPAPERGREYVCGWAHY